MLETPTKTRTILFVCTGNTCRSPMAEAIALDLLRSHEHWAERVRVFSAGVGAGEGAPTTEEAVESLRRLGVEAPRHRSVQLTAEMIRGADLIFGMTRSHVDAVRAIDESAAGKIFPLDPEARDVPDPIGGPQSIYDETARRLRELVEQRLRETLEA